MKNFYLLFIISSIFFSYAQNNGLFYYSFENQIPLTAVENQSIVEFIGAPDENYLINNGLTYDKIGQNLFLVNGDFTNTKNSGTGVYYTLPAYETENGNPIHMYNKIVLRWEDETQEAEKTNLINQFGLVQEKTNRLFTVYKTPAPLTTSQLVYESGLVRYCHPVFLAYIEDFSSVPASQSISKRNYFNAPKKSISYSEEENLPQYIPNDEYFPQQFYLHNTGQELNDGRFGTPDADIDAPEAWMITKGDPNVVVAVIDYGVTNDHPDLPNTRQVRLQGSNFSWNATTVIPPYDNPDDPSPVQYNYLQNHGNACAGVIAAEMDNYEGVVGIAPECKIMPIRVGTEYYPTWELNASALTFCVDSLANVISCSWGNGIEGVPPDLSPVFIDAMEDALDNNVNIIFSAGNTANQSGIVPPPKPPFIYQGHVAFPANADVPHLITVGASDRNDLQANYSPTNELIDIVAPSNTFFNYLVENEHKNIWTIDMLGLDGQNDKDDDLPTSGINDNFTSYTGRFGGTSAAAPEVAGVVALMLSVNPCLNPRQVTEILFNTTDKVGGYNYNWNAEKPGHSQELGYGRLNAYKAVALTQATYSPTIDLYTKDYIADFGQEPYTDFPSFSWNSHDIWVRHENDGVVEHQNPQFDPVKPNYIYVKIANKSCQTSTGNEQCKLYWTKNNTTPIWPIHWDGTYFINGVQMGDEIGAATIPVLEPGEETIISIPWMVPNPDDFSGITEDPWSFSLLSRIESTDDPIAFPEGKNTYVNVMNNNNIAMKSLTLIKTESDESLLGGTFALTNPYEDTHTFSLEIAIPENEAGKAIYEEAEVGFKMSDELYSKWVSGGQDAENLSATNSFKKKIVTDNIAQINHITLAPDETVLAYLSFNFLTEELTNKNNFFYHLLIKDETNDELIGGNTYQIQKQTRDIFTADAGDDKEINLNDTITITAELIDEIAVYNWYDPEGNLIYTGKDLNISPEISKIYKLEVIADADGFKDYDEVAISVNPFVLGDLIPNPANDTLNLSYLAQTATSPYIMLVNINTGIANNYILDTNLQEIDIDISAYTTGYYEVILICNGQVTGMKTLIKN